MSVPTAHLPTIIIVPGIFHVAWHMNLLVTELHTLGFETQVLDLPTVNASPEPDCYERDVATIKTAIANQVNANKDVILLMHSYGGIPGTEAACGFGTTTPINTSKPHGVVLKLIYLAALLFKEDTNILSIPYPWPIVAKPDEQNNAIVLPLNPLQDYYHDVPSPLREQAAARLVPTAASFLTLAKAKACAWREIPTAYVVCEDDRAVPMRLQELLIRGVRDEGVEVAEVRLKGSSHSPFLSMPGRLAGVIGDIVG